MSLIAGLDALRGAGQRRMSKAVNQRQKAPGHVVDVSLLVGRAARHQTRAFPTLCARGAARPCPDVRPSHAEVGLGVRAPGQRRDGAGASRRRRLTSDSLGAAGGETFGSNLYTVRCPL